MYESLSDQITSQRPTVVEVDLGAISANYNAIKAHTAPRKVLCVLKANAYGHGLVRVAQHLQSIDVDYLGVAYLEEGILLRKSGIRIPILVMGGILGNQIPHFIDYDLTITASSVDKLQQIEHVAKMMGQVAKVHLKIDTGMERIGVHYYSAQSLLEASLRVRHCHVEGIYTHLANADRENGEYTRLQLQRFADTLHYYDEMGVSRPLVHFSNSAGIGFKDVLSADMVRTGLLLYGVYPSDNLAPLIPVRPALTWKTRVVYFKVVQPDHPVSYGSRWQSDKLTRVVTIPVGYGDGYMRAMSHKAQVLIRGKKYPSIGSICMDQMMVNINWSTAYNDDEVVLIGRQGNEEITVADLAKWANTIPYEILTNINTRVPRVYLG